MLMSFEVPLCLVPITLQPLLRNLFAINNPKPEEAPVTNTVFHFHILLYRLTRKGIDLLPVMIEINLWAEKYFTIPADRKKMLKDVKKDKEGFIKAMTKELEL